MRCRTPRGLVFEVWRCAATLFAGIAAGIKSDVPLPLRRGVRIADALTMVPTWMSAKTDLPAVGAMAVFASDEFGHGLSKRVRAGIGKARQIAAT
jgi:hypothetical protein